MLANMYAVKKVKLVNNRFEKLHRSQQQEKRILLKFFFIKRNFACAAASIFRNLSFLLLDKQYNKNKEVTIVITKPDKNKTRQKRHRRVRNNISGTAERPRLNVFRSNKNIYAQIIDDVAGVTLASASTLDKEISGGTKTEAAQAVGKLVAERATEKGIKVVVFDRGGYLYHGRVQALAEAARENGLEF